ncbi:hypothetical protein LB105_003959 [Salmonella enterica]|uniref:Uncharacterized protein n=1 Tax=Salmonella enterica subsp. diarizonae serovar 48:i:z TaxID=1192842 RepID=A0A7U5YIE1_SALDZ|nr:hypothetical protein [Salmonella enterica]EAW2211425.1 hypothetical protein [Salmonella enterica subsp. enterica]EBW8395873.1 hypothetical protein [Salmonella enterica subsp. enterica serovar Florida]EDC1627244.1 hypothetical protein [Salmonella enterica subsp. enterica serovar Newport]AXC73437.1 hypothetical protein DOE59_18850 [Salmonella enterica subsp. diarizonae serovar 48:i:z]EAS1838176.1 hypothetical protein [Salmonella enterica]
MTKPFTDTSVFALLMHTPCPDTSVNELRQLVDSGETAVTAYLEGLSAIGNLTYWACASENYSDHASDLQALGKFLQHTADMIRAVDDSATLLRESVERKESRK